MIKKEKYKYQVKFDIIACFDKRGSKFHYGKISGINIGESKEINYNFEGRFYSAFETKKNNFYYLTEKHKVKYMSSTDNYNLYIGGFSLFCDKLSTIFNNEDIQYRLERISDYNDYKYKLTVRIKLSNRIFLFHITASCPLHCGYGCYKEGFKILIDNFRKCKKDFTTTDGAYNKEKIIAMLLVLEQSNLNIHN